MTAPRVAVIGGGAAGLAAARVLTRDLTSCQVTVLEQREALGGVWNYDHQSSTHPMYQNLRTNLPKEIMQFREFPWNDVADYEPNQPKSSFLTHRQVLQYLQRYAHHFGLEPFLRFQAEVQQLTVLEGTESFFQPPDQVWPKIRLQWKEGLSPKSEIFDAVCICNGHYNKPATPEIPGLNEYFSGEVLHSVAYDTPNRFANKTVLCIGGRASGSDIARELVTLGNAKHVFLSDSVCQQAQETPHHVTWVPATSRFLPGGHLRFGNNCPLEPTVDTVLFCTGYDYDFPFMTKDSSGSPLVEARQRRVQPLYHQMWHATYPNMAFIGLPHSVVPFPMFELQMEAFCSQLANWKLDDLTERLQVAQKDASSGGVCRLRVPEDTHFLGDAQWDYCRQLAQFADLAPCSEEDGNNSILNYIATNKAIYDHAAKARKGALPGRIDTYRSLCYERNDTERTFTSWSCENKNALVET